MARNVSFYGQGELLKPEARRPDMLQSLGAKMMMDGSSTAPVSSITEGMARALTGISGGYFSHLAQKKQDEKDAAASAEMMKILMGAQGSPAIPGPAPSSPAGGARAAAGDPAPAPAMPGGYEGMIAAGAGAQTPEGRQLLMQALMGQTEAKQQAAAREAEIQAAKDMYLFEQQNKAPTPPKEMVLFRMAQTDPEFAKFLAASNTQNTPSAVAEYQFFKNLSPEDQTRFLAVKRANPYLNRGDAFVQMDPASPGTVVDEVPKGIEPTRTVQDDRVITLPAVSPTQEEGGLPTTPGPAISDLPPSPKEARDIAEKEAQAAKREEQKATYSDIVTEDIGRAIDKIENASIPVTSAGAALSAVPGTPAHDVARLLDTIKANAGFDRLQQMREQSPTGGALGQVSEFENRLLQATIGNLEQSQSKEQLIYNLNRVRDTYLDIVHGPGNRPSKESQNASQPSGFTVRKVK